MQQLQQLAFRAEVIPIATPLDDAHQVFQDELAGIEQAPVERLHLVHVKKEAALQTVCPAVPAAGLAEISVD